MVSRAVLKTQPDGKLATLAAAGSEPAFEAIVHRYRRPLLGYCRRLRLSDNRSEDVVQQTFLNAWGSLRDGTEVRELRPWLYRITHNQAVTMMRATGRDETPLSELAGGPVPLAGQETSESTWAAADVYERQARLKETLIAVAALPALQREALLATAVDGLSYDQVALVLNTSSDAVRGLVYRARNTLRTGVAVLSPGPLVLWAANQAGQAVSASTVQGWLTEATAGGSTVGLGAVAVKGAAVLASSAVVVTGTVGVGLEKHVFTGASAHHSLPTARAAAPRTGHSSPAHGRTATGRGGSYAVLTASWGRVAHGASGSVSAMGAAHLGARLEGSHGATVARFAGGARTPTAGARAGTGAGVSGEGLLGAGAASADGDGLTRTSSGTLAHRGATPTSGTAPTGMQMGAAIRQQGLRQQPAPTGTTGSGSSTAPSPSSTPAPGGDTASSSPSNPSTPARTSSADTSITTSTSATPSTLIPTVLAQSTTTTASVTTTTAQSTTAPGVDTTSSSK